MPIQAPQWTDYLNCPACCREFAPRRSPVSLGCGHTLCRPCLKNLLRKQCPFDQTVISVDPEELVVNTALLQLMGYDPPAQPYHPPSIQALPEQDRRAYDVIVKCLEQLAVFLKYCGNASVNTMGSRLSRPMQRKLVTLLQCAMMDEEGRGKAARAARSLGERTVSELILQHQNPQQLSANLWAAVRARGCQFLGPAMQEEVLKLVLLALEDGSALSRKVLVMFVVQRLEPHFHQASKTSIGHVVQLLYRASCFKVSKRESDSSLMQLKEEFRTYELLRREHDAQIVQIATEAGLRIAPDQWSALLYGDTLHKSHMQSIIDKLQTPHSFAQSVQELFIALQRTGDPAQLIVMSIPLDRLTNIDASPDAKSPSWQDLSEIMSALKDVVSGLVDYMQHHASARDANHNAKADRLPDSTQPSTMQGGLLPGRYKVAMCRDAQNKTYCPRGNHCTYAHSEEELERFRRVDPGNGSLPYLVPVMPLPGAMPRPMNPFPRFSVPPPPLPNMDNNYNILPIQQQSPSARRSMILPELPDHDFEPDREHRRPSFDHQQFDHPPPNVNDNFMGSYANALMHRPSESLQNQHQNVGLNSMNGGGLGNLNGGLSPLNGGMSPLNGGMSPLNGRMNPLNTGMNPLNSGMNPLNSGMNPLNSGMNPLNSGMNPLNNGMNPLNNGMNPHNNGMNPLNSGLNHYNGGINHLNSGMIPLNRSMNHLNAGMDHLNGGINHLNDGLGTLNGGMNPLSGAMDPLSEELNLINGGLSTVQTDSRFFPRQSSERAAYPYTPQRDGSLLGESSAFQGLGPCGSIASNADYSHQAFGDDSVSDVPFEPFGLGASHSMGLSSQDTTWAPPPPPPTNNAMKRPTMFKFNEMAKNLPPGVDRANGLPMGVNLSSNNPLMDLNNVPIGSSMPISSNLPIGSNVPIGNNLPIGSNVPIGNNVPIGSNVPIGNNVPIGSNVPIGNNESDSTNSLVPIDSDLAISSNEPATGEIIRMRSQRVVRQVKKKRPDDKKYDQVLEQELHALELKITTEFSESSPEVSDSEDDI